MPSTSPAQARLMAAIAHGWHPTGLKHAPSQAVARDFNQADKGSALLSHAMQHHAAGGTISPLASLVGNPMSMRSTVPHMGQAVPGHMRMPHIPLVDTMHNIDQHMSGARVKLPALKARMGGSTCTYADGGAVPLTLSAVNAVKDALTHLANRDASSAAATLRSSPEAMQHPVVQHAAEALRAAIGIAPATRDLTNIVGGNANSPHSP